MSEARTIKVKIVGDSRRLEAALGTRSVPGYRLVHQVRPNGQHRVLCVDGRYRRVNHRLGRRQNLHRPGDRVIDQRPGYAGRWLRALGLSVRRATTAMMLSAVPLAKVMRDFAIAVEKIQRDRAIERLTPRQTDQI